MAAPGGEKGPVLLPLACLLVVAVVPLGLALTIEDYSYDIWGAFIVGPPVMLICLALARRVARVTGELQVASFLFGAAFLKVIIGPLLRYSTAQQFYGRIADAGGYDDAGALLAPLFRRGIVPELGSVTKTTFIEVLSGVVQAFIGDTRLGNYLVFSLFGFIGLICFYLAFCEAFPEGDRRLYRLVLFLTPTLWYWPSSIGKEAFMLMCLGGATLGAVRLFSGRTSGVVLGGLGLWGTYVVRPHITLMFFCGFALAALPFGRMTARIRGSRRWVSVVLTVVAFAFVPAAIASVEELLKLDDLNVDSAETAFDEVTRRTSQGGSEFTVGSTFSPAGFGVGLVTVLLRPFPWESPGAQGLLSSAEMVVLCGILGIAAFHRARGIWAQRSNRLLRLCVGYTIAFATAFASVGNFGILARQRSLLLPFVMAVVACAKRPGAQPDADADGAAEHEASGGAEAGAALTGA
jgi:hypothetical protein